MLATMEGAPFLFFYAVLSGICVFVSSKSIAGYMGGQNEVSCRTKSDYLSSKSCVEGTLTHMGYNTPTADSKQYQNAIKAYQRFYNLEITGHINDETAELLAQRGCGVPDILPEYKAEPDVRFGKRPKRQINFSLRPYWVVKRIPWCINATSIHLSPEDQVKAIQWALEKWAEHSQLTFHRVTNCRFALITVEWATGDHNDFNSFDGRGGVLAHAILPVLAYLVQDLAGDVHFDDAEQWSLSSEPLGSYSDKTLLKPIALHELGHSIGLVHSNLRSSIMYRYYRSNANPSLGPSDIQAVQSYYGAPLSNTGQVVETLNICEEDSRLTIQAIAMMGDGITYAFNGPRYWKIGRNGLADQQSKPIRENWKDSMGRGLEGYFDAVLFIPNGVCKPTCVGDTYFIKGSTVWQMVSSDGTSGVTTQRDFLAVFPRAPIGIDAAFLWTYAVDSTRDLQIYLIKGQEYFRAGSNGPPYTVVSLNYLNLLWNLDWKEGNFRAAMVRWDYDPITDSTIVDNCFFQYGYYGCYTGGSKQIDEGYPRNVKHWYGCDGYREDDSTDSADVTSTMSTMSPQETYFCDNLPQIQASTMLGDGFVYMFSGTHYWRKSLNGDTEKEFKSITTNWFGEGLVGNFDAVVFRPFDDCTPPCRGTTYFFQQEKIFVKHDSYGTSGFLYRYNTDILPNLPISIDSATVVPSNRCDRCFNLYFTKGYQHFVTNDTHSFSYSNPYTVRQVENTLWRRRVWSTADAIFFDWNRQDSSQFYYIIKNDEYILYDSSSDTVEDDYPRTMLSLFNC